MMRPRYQSGFTLVEVVVYLGIFSFISVASLSLLFSVHGLFMQYQVRQDLFVTSTTVLERLLLEVREADTVQASDSTFATTSSRLVLADTDANEVTFARSGDTLEFTDSTGTTIPLHDSGVRVESFLVRYYEEAERGYVAVTLDLAAEEQQYQETFSLTGGAVVRGMYVQDD